MKREQNEICEEYQRWLLHAKDSREISHELVAMENSREKISDAFYKDLEFGTGGLRGILGAGTNRMNLYTVSRASMGVADYICSNFSTGSRSVSISYDSRKNSRLFAETAAKIFISKGITVHIYKVLAPTPMLSWAVRKLGCSAGIMITASHNPAEYNGYKVYGADGCQITTAAAKEIYERIQRFDYFSEFSDASFDEGIQSGKILWINHDIIGEFLSAVKQQSLLTEEEQKVYGKLSVIYSPLHGTGREPVLQVLKESGFSDVTVVKEQEMPDELFSACPYPNPEVKEAMDLGIKYAIKYKADLFVATDPDCDRAGIAVRTKDGCYELLTANQTGALLLDYICKKRISARTMPKDPIFIKTIVTTDLAERIADFYGVKTINVLTGFKYIGEQIGLLEDKGLSESFILGFEESYGYLSGTYVRDKDGVGAVFLICEMAAYYKSLGKGLKDVLDELYGRFGRCLNSLHSYKFEGQAGFNRMEAIMEQFRQYEEIFSKRRTELEISGLPMEWGGRKILFIEDYLKKVKLDSEGTVSKLEDIPVSDVVKIQLEGQCSVVIRPSGTEPKLKVYITVISSEKEAGVIIEQKIAMAIERFIGTHTL